MLVPDAPELPVAIIGVRDLASWLVSCAERSVSGVFNAMGSPIPLPDHLEAARQVAGRDCILVPAAESWLSEQRVSEWSGPRSLPLWVVDRTWYGFNARSNQRAIAAGLTLRPLSETLADSHAWRLAQPDDAELTAGLSDDDERQLLAMLR